MAWGLIIDYFSRKVLSDNLSQVITGGSVMAHATGKPDEHVRVELPVRASSLPKGDYQTLVMLRRAADYIDSIFLRQTNQDLEATGGVFDKSRGTDSYPADLTKEELEGYIAQHPNEKQALLDPLTVVQRDGDMLRAIPYRGLYKYDLERTAAYVFEASKHTTDPYLLSFLHGRAKAFLSDDYKTSDREWVRLPAGSLEVIIGPFEEYFDEIMGVKRWNTSKTISTNSSS